MVNLKVLETLKMITADASLLADTQLVADNGETRRCATKSWMIQEEYLF